MRVSIGRRLHSAVDRVFPRDHAVLSAAYGALHLLIEYRVEIESAQQKSKNKRVVGAQISNAPYCIIRIDRTNVSITQRRPTLDDRWSRAPQ